MHGGRAGVDARLESMQGVNDVDIDVNCKGVRDAQRLEWISTKDLGNKSFVQNGLHTYAEEMLSQIIRCKV